MKSTPPHNGSVPKPQAADGRQANGRFAPGNLGGPGNPYARKVAALRKAVVDSVSAVDIEAVFAVLLTKAKEGDTAAAKLLFQYALGKPGAAADPDRVDVDEWKLMQEKSRPPAEMTTVTEGLPVNLATQLANIAWPCKVRAGLTDPLLAGFAKLDRRDAKLRKKGMKGNGLPDAIIDRLAFGPSGAEELALCGGDGTPSPNEDNGRRRPKRKRPPHGKRP